MHAPWARDFIGIPYKMHTNTRESCDCYGLVCLVYKDVFNINLPTYSDKYEEHDSDESIIEIFDEEKHKWELVGEPIIGDIVYFVIAGQPKHVGVVVGDGLFLHNLNKAGAVIASYKCNKWKRRVLGFYHYATSSI